MKYGCNLKIADEYTSKFQNSYMDLRLRVLSRGW